MSDSLSTEHSANSTFETVEEALAAILEGLDPGQPLYEIRVTMNDEGHYGISLEGI